MKRITTIFAVLVFSVVVGTPSTAQGPPAHDAPDLGAMMQSMTGAMGDMYGNLVRSMSAALADPVTAQHLATFTRNYYDQLVAAGFTKEEALKIVIGIGIPFTPSGK